MTLGFYNRPKKNVYRWPLATGWALHLFPRRLLKLVRLPPKLRLPSRALSMWHDREDLRAKFNLHTVTGRRALMRWFLFHGCREAHFPPPAEEGSQLAPLQAPYPGLDCLAVLPVTWLMFEIARRERAEEFDLCTHNGQDRLLSWMFRKGLAKYALLHLLTETQAAALLALDDSSAPLLVAWIWKAEPDLRARFDGPDDPLLTEWLKENGAALCSLLAHPLIGLADAGRRPPDPALPFGVNLIGHARERLGIGEDVRMAALALSAVSIPFVIRNLPAGDLGPQETSVDAHLSDLYPYSTTMFCTTGIETLRAVATMGSGIIDRRRAIGFWPWELPEWPAFLSHAFDNVDEVWASSRYTWDAFARSSPVPVRQMPMVVSLDETQGLTRVDFGLPSDRFLFAFAYDGLSHSARKNPEACLAAFDRAFHASDEPVGLVIKGLRTEGSAAWKLLEARAQTDRRLFLITESLPRARLLDLYRAIDCFVSLHRAEGFGRNIAECMGLGKPVIVTAHSGNMDFTTYDTAALVPARLRPLSSGDYPYGDGQIWAEPDVDAAAAHMRRMVADTLWRDDLGRRGAEKIERDYSAEAVGRAWAQSLAAPLD